MAHLFRLEPKDFSADGKYVGVNIYKTVPGLTPGTTDKLPVDVAIFIPPDMGRVIFPEDLKIGRELIIGSGTQAIFQSDLAAGSVAAQEKIACRGNITIAGAFDSQKGIVCRGNILASSVSAGENLNCGGDVVALTVSVKQDINAHEVHSADISCKKLTASAVFTNRIAVTGDLHAELLEAKTGYVVGQAYGNNLAVPDEVHFDRVPKKYDGARIVEDVSVQHDSSYNAAVQRNLPHPSPRPEMAQN